eukprot:10013.XXX_348729_349526_1 [CDS] Oithona nana genome sequencing.
MWSVSSVKPYLKRRKKCCFPLNKLLVLLVLLVLTVICNHANHYSYNNYNSSFYICHSICRSHSCHTQLQTLKTHLPVFCSNKDRGCQEILMKEEMISHEKECVYRPINCPDLKCTAKVTYHGLLDHFTEVHKDYISMNALKKKKFLITSKIGVDLKPTELLPPTRITAFDRTFFEVGIIKDQLMLRWIYILGDPDVAKNFSYTVRVKKENIEMSFSRKVKSLSEHYNDITKVKQAFVMPVDEELLYDTNNIVFEYKIRNLKEEAKD